jgi:hypothetical protein
VSAKEAAATASLNHFLKPAMMASKIPAEPVMQIVLEQGMLLFAVMGKSALSLKRVMMVSRMLAEAATPTVLQRALVPRAVMG